MPFQTKIKTIREIFVVDSLDDWNKITPAEILEINGIGPSTLDHLRLYLAARGTTLRDDQTPAHWQARIDRAKIGEQLTDDDDGIACDFVVLVDSQEKKPFRFEGLTTDADRGNRPLLVETKWESLGPAWGDYSIDGYQGDVHIERKSRDDFISTLLGYGDRWERFERELNNLQTIKAAAVVVECSLGGALASIKSTAHKTESENRKTVFRKYLALAADYRIPWHFCDSRRLAEQAAFRVLARFWKKQKEAEKDRPAVIDIDDILGGL
jgi:hypothetical protein